MAHLPLSEETSECLPWGTPDIQIGVKEWNADGTRLLANVLPRNTTIDQYDSVPQENIFLIKRDNPQQAYRKEIFRTESGQKIPNGMSRPLGLHGSRGKMHLCELLPRVHTNVEDQQVVFQELGKKERQRVCIKEIYRTNGDDEMQVSLGDEALTLQEKIAKMNANVHRNGYQENSYNEARIMQKIGTNSNGNVMHCIEVLITRKSVFLVMPYASGKALPREKNGEQEAKQRLRQILANVKYIHNTGNFFHRDFKHDNIVINADGSTTLIDFGMSLMMPHNETNRFLIKARGICGTAEYMAPEMIQNDNYDGYALDIWALGIILFYSLTGDFLVTGPGLPIVSDEYNEGGEIIRYANREFQHFVVHNCLNDTRDANNRNEAFLLHPDTPENERFKRMIRAVLALSSNARKLLWGMLKKDRRERFTLEDIEQHPWLSEEANQRIDEGG